jgi:hypothetical protein
VAQAHAAWGTATCRKTHETGSCEIGIYHSELLFPFLFTLDHAGDFVHCCLFFEGRHLRLIHHFSHVLFSHIDNRFLLRPSVGPVCSILSTPVYHTSRVVARLLSYMLSDTMSQIQWHIWLCPYKNIDAIATVMDGHVRFIHSSRGTEPI